MCSTINAKHGSDCGHPVVNMDCCCIEKSKKQVDVKHLQQCADLLKQKAEKIEDFIGKQK